MPKQMLEILMHDLLLKHPLPWKIDHDWGYDIIDAKDREVIHCLMNFADARAIIDKAVEMQKQFDKASGAIRKKELGIENE